MPYKTKWAAFQQPNPDFMLNRWLSVSFNRENLTALVHAGFQVNVVRTAQFTRSFVFNPGYGLHLLAGAAHANAALGHFFAWNSHI
jgi:hypothetical protein